MATANSYGAKDIEVLEGLDPVRRRPGMYIGGTEKSGLHHLVREILDNSVDEAMNGHADRIELTLHKGGDCITITDNGRGIPVDKHPKFKKSALEIILTTLHAGGKFSERNYASAGGLHGVGASVVNALSEDFTALVWRDGYEWTQTFSRGKPTGAVKKGAKIRKHGTSITFKPDAEIFRVTQFSVDELQQMLKEKAFLNKGLTLLFVNEVDQTKEEFYFDDGVQSYLGTLLEESKQNPVGDERFILEQEDGVKIEAAFCWTEGTNERILSYVNGIHTKGGGSHTDGFRSGIVKAVRNYINVHNLTPRGVKLVAEDVREGIVCVLSVNVPGAISQLQFQGQTKDKLNNPEIVGAVDVLTRSFENVLNENPKLASIIVERVFLASKARAAARAASQNVSRKVGANRRLNLPGKLADCSSTSPAKSELFIVEGDSAGGTAKQGRDRKTQAILPLRGKVLNAISASADKVISNKEFQDLISAIGCGVGDKFQVSKLRYGKVVILTDADADGMHIAALLMAFFYRFMRPMIEEGHLFLGLSPLYRIRYGSGKSEELYWVYTDEEKEELLKTTKRKNPHITRFKGLGEMNSSTLWDTTLSPKSRKLLKIQIDDLQESDAVMESLLGKDSSSRYELIQQHAPRLELDV
ncbi:MAG: type IIA DNA topoisomerase subunit B [Bdellovibrionales bacterium]|nr:type IIA DNA topoisomerase subunit B [Bdellovibrionales bacterium]